MLLVLAIIFNYTIHVKSRFRIFRDGGKVGGASILLLWISVPFGGIWISSYKEWKSSMTIAQISHSIQSIGFSRQYMGVGIYLPDDFVDASATIAALAGMILMTDFRILGWAMKEVLVSSNT